MNGRVTLDGIMFDLLRFPPFTVTIGCVRAKASVLSRISNDFAMHEVVKWGAFEFIGLERTKNWIVLFELLKYWFECIVMYKICMTYSNVINKV